MGGGGGVTRPTTNKTTAKIITPEPEGLVMHFDYQLRPGIATSTNALKLLEMVGWTIEDVQA